AWTDRHRCCLDAGDPPRLAENRNIAMLRAGLHSAIAFVVVLSANFGASLNVAVANGYGSLRSPTLGAIFAVATFPTGLVYSLERTYSNLELMALPNPGLWGLAAVIVALFASARSRSPVASLASGIRDAEPVVPWWSRAFGPKAKM